MIIKGVLREELRNSRRMLGRYEKALAKLPRGSLVKRKIKGHEYYYLIFRENGKVRSVYQGKSVPERDILKYRKAKERRAEYRKSLSQLKKQIRFLERALRGKEDV